MNFSNNTTYRTIAAAAFAIGISLPVYAETVDVETAGSVQPEGMVSQTTKMVTTTTTHGMAKHKVHHAQSKMTKRMEVEQDNPNSTKKVILKNGVIFNDVEPTAESQNSPFGVPTSTDDTLKGGITSTLAPAPTN